MSTDLFPMMTADEARACVDAINGHVEDIRTLALQLYERRGWEALGYRSWRACVVAEFDQSKSHLYRQLQAALIERDVEDSIGRVVEVSPIGETSTTIHGKPSTRPAPIPESQLRPLAKLPEPARRREAWEEAKATAPNGQVTAQHVEAVVQKRRAAPAPAGTSRVNGVLAPDPPDVAAARAAGRLAPDVVPEVAEPGPTPEATERGGPIADGAATEAGLDDAAWLATLPVREALPEGRRRKFDADALDYRHLEPHRKAFQHHARRTLRGGGEYAYRTTRFLRTDHPRHWLACPAPEHGGCGGTGEVPLIGACPKCRGRGYWVK